MWKIEVYQGNNTITATPSDPKGIVDEIKYSIDTYGYCLDASFKVINKYLQIKPNNEVTIYYKTFPVFRGYVTSAPNAYSEEVGTVELAAIKRKMYNFLLKDIYLYNANGLSIQDIMNAIQAKIPWTITNINVLPTSAAFGKTFAADNIFLGETLDKLLQQVSFTWGTTENGTIGLYNLGWYNIIGLGAYPNSILSLENNTSDSLVTEVKFIFSFPKGFESLGNSDTVNFKRYTYHSTLDTAFSYDDVRALDYTYTDTSLTSTWGTYTKIVPLVLSESYLKETPLNTLNSSILILTNIQTNTGATDQTSILNVLSDNNDSTYVSPINSSNYGTLYIRINNTSISKQKDFISLKARLNGQGDTFNDLLVRIIISNYINPNNYYSHLDFYTAKIDAYNLNLIAPWYPKNRFIETYKVAPYDNTNFVDIQFYSNPTSTFTLRELKIIQLKTDILDNLAKKFIRVPTSFPATVSIFGDIVATSRTAIIVPASKIPGYVGSDITSTIEKKEYIISNEKGILTRLYLEHDPQKRDNLVLQRILKELQSGDSSTFVTSQGVS